MNENTSVLADLQLQHHFGGGVYAKETIIPAGLVLVQHKHAHDHLSILASGTVVLEVEGERRTLVGPACVTVEAGKHHGVRAITEAVWYCIHATDNTDAETVDGKLIAADSRASDMQAMAEALAR
ncbi:cupin domain-containing protein [Variovorax sp.]|uniref:cupin domain-containing protein n=1 Tax=Variovorax sp. TaxID=1871043 RepID=UPI003BABA6F0